MDAVLEGMICIVCVAAVLGGCKQRRALLYKAPCKRASPQQVLVRQVPQHSNMGLIPPWVLIPCPKSFITQGAQLNSMSRPLETYRPLILASSGTLWLLRVPSLLLYHFISNPCTSLPPGIAAICTHSAPLLPSFPLPKP